MKKRTIWSIFLSFLLIGIIALTAGLAMGAKPQEFLQITLGEGQLSLIGAAPNSLFGAGESMEEIEVPEKEKRFSAQEIQELTISVHSGVVEIWPTSGEEIICYSNRRDSFYGQKGSRLTLKDEGLNTAIQLRIYLPEKVWDEVELELGACRVSLEKMKAREMTVELGSGHLEAGYLETEKSMSIQVGAGLAEVEGCLAKKLELECGMGSMKICLEGTEEEYNYKLECGMGNLQIGEDSFSGFGGEREVDNHAGRQLNAECGMGNLEIAFNQN